MAQTTVGDGKEGGSRRRRGRRGRGGDRADRHPTGDEQSGASIERGPNVADVVEMVADSALVDEGASAPMRESRPQKPPREPREPREQREAREPREPRESREHRDAAAAAPAPMAQVSAPTESMHAEPAASEVHVEAVPRAAPAPVARPVVPDFPPIALTLPPDSGLILVETSHPAPVISMESEAPRPKRVRPPRVEIPSEPLEIIETRKE
jgi:hypothetical protein